MLALAHSFYRGVVWASLTAAYYIADEDVVTLPPEAIYSYALHMLHRVVSRPSP